MWHTGLVAPPHVGPSLTRNQTLSLPLVGGFFTAEPPGKACFFFFLMKGHIGVDTVLEQTTIPAMGEGRAG